MRIPTLSSDPFVALELMRRIESRRGKKKKRSLKEFLFKKTPPVVGFIPEDHRK